MWIHTCDVDAMGMSQPFFVVDIKIAKDHNLSKRIMGDGRIPMVLDTESRTVRLGEDGDLQGKYRWVTECKRQGENT